MRQISSGGFVYWPGEAISHDWATSMVGEVLTEARRQGFAVSNQAYDKWKAYQHRAARGYRHSTDKSQDVIQAYRLYTLALSGEQPSGAMNKLREYQNSTKGISKQALLRLAATYALTGRSDVASKLLEAADNMPVVSGSYETFWSPLRDEAMALEAYLLGGDRVKAFDLAREIASSFSTTKASTQEVAFVSVAMSRMAEIFGNAPTQVSILDGENSTKIVGDLSGVKQFNITPRNGYIEVENQGGEEVSLSLMLKRKPSVSETVRPESNGVAIKVQYTDLKGNAIEVDKVKQGQEFLAQIEVKKDGEYSQSMALTYQVPSGWEIWNERLIAGEENPQVTHTDIRDDRICWYFSLRQGKTKNFTVRLRAAYTGVFVLPPTVCEDMYNISCKANTQSRRIAIF